MLVVQEDVMLDEELEEENSAEEIYAETHEVDELERHQLQQELKLKVLSEDPPFRWSLRFQDPRIEQDYLETTLPRLISSIVCMNSLCLCICVLLCAFIVQVRAEIMSEGTPSQESFRLDLYRLTLLASCAGLSAVWVVVMKVPVVRQSLRTEYLEVVCILYVMLLMCVTVLVHPQYCGTVFAIPVEVFEHLVKQGIECHGKPFLCSTSLLLHDGGLLLALDAIITSVHLSPIRWSAVWPLDLFALLCYAVAAWCLGSYESTPATICYFFILSGLVLAASIGKRMLERQDRQAYWHILGEKQLRQLAELQLRELHEKREEMIEQTLKENPNCNSNVTSTGTEGVFGAILEDSPDSLRHALERISKLGFEEKWLISAEELELMPDRILGCGGFGIVMAAKHHGTLVAVKVPRCSHDKVLVSGLLSMANEIRVLRQVRHPNLVLFYGACVDPVSSEVALVLEYAQGSRLTTIVKNPRLSLGHRHMITLDVCIALRYLHSQKPCIVHGDLKGPNVLVELYAGMPRAKLIDFGLSRIISRRAKPLSGTLVWMAPELLRQHRVPPAASADVFSFGRLLFLIMTGLAPLQKAASYHLVAEAKQGRVPELRWPEGSDTEPLYRESRKMCCKCLEFESSLRPSMIQIHEAVDSWGRDMLAGSTPQRLASAAAQAVPDSAPPSAPQSVVDLSGHSGNSPGGSESGGTSGTMQFQEKLREARRFVLTDETLKASEAAMTSQSRNRSGMRYQKEAVSEDDGTSLSSLHSVSSALSRQGSQGPLEASAPAPNSPAAKTSQLAL
eukprot:TRINITY_DN77578_c0_g1_i1.p1 TRINITY_DN77578_c0_g1~~TRINITY_DN77578_c0_g1_i1.p1  ORF type:complete len:791 (+),score=132.14 TRINITY_DN77578_c0_g1_i1:25-2397(+)